MTTTSRPAFSGIYPVSEAALFIHATMGAISPYRPPFKPIPKGAFKGVSTRHVHDWARDGLASNYLAGVSARDTTLNFLDLISLRLIAAMRVHGVAPDDIQEAHTLLQSKWGVTHPFAMKPLWVYGRPVFIRENLTFLSINKGWQAAFDFIENYLTRLHGITFGHDQAATTWEPSRGVLLDPGIQFGEPCISGTRVATEVLWSFHVAGDSEKELARMYGIDISRIEAALDWERKLAAARNSRVSLILAPSLS